MDDETVTPSIRASLIVRDFGNDPATVSNILGLAPTRTGVAGAMIPSPHGGRGSRMVRRTFWAIQSDRAPSASLAEHIENIVVRIGGAASAFVRLPVGTTVTLLCTIIPEGDLPLIRVDAEGMKALGEIGATLELDVISVGQPTDTV